MPDNPPIILSSASALAAPLAEPDDRATARRLGLRRTKADRLTIRRVRCGRGFSYVTAEGERVRDRAALARYASLAVPPAYKDVMFADDPAAHIQAIGRDDAGHLQYRYHPDCVKVREQRKAQRLLRPVTRLATIRRRVTRHLAAPAPTPEFALAAAIELVAGTAIRADDEAYARERGTRGAATLWKSVKIEGDAIMLAFRAKGGKETRKEMQSARLAAALKHLAGLPGRRLFQDRGEDGEIT